MDAFRQKRSKVGTADRSSGGRALREGNRRIQKHRNCPSFASESSSSSSGITHEDWLMFDMGWRSSNQAAGTPMKKLLAKEMTQETDHRRSQGVIARLMGLETLPPQQPPRLKQLKRRTEENQSATKVEKSERSSPFASYRSSRKSSREEQAFKDVFEVVEAPKSMKNCHRPAVTARSGITEDEMEFIRQKFMEAKCLSTKDRLHHSKEFHDTIEVLDSNRDLLLKFLLQPNSLFTKHLHDLHGSPLQSHYDRRISSESSFPQSKTLGRDRIGISCNKSYQKHRVSSHLKPIISPEKVEPDIVPTRIVVLKPNLGKTKDSATCVSSPTSYSLLSDTSSFAEFSISGHKGNKPSRSRKIAREVTREIKSALNSRRCSADESSSTGDNSADEESDITILTSRKSLYSNHNLKPSCSSGESSVSREAEAVRRLSRRWRVAHKSQEIEEISRGSTLADMLSLTDRDLRHHNMETERVRQKLTSSVVREPLGISSRDGWKDVFVKGLSKSRSVLNSSDFPVSPKSSLRIESPRNCRYTVPTEVMKWEKNKKVMRGKVKSRNAESYYFTRGESSNASPEIHPDSNFLKCPVVSEAPAPACNVLENLPDLENDIDESALSPQTKKLSDLPSKECPDPARSKEAEQPSPVSTLEAPFTDDVSSGSECFESLSADLHGLRMQLRLLKLESGSSYHGTETLQDHSLSDEDAAPNQVDANWDSSYITEVLIGSGYDKPKPNTFLTNPHSLDYPINPSLFEHLEQSYPINSGRPERKLLFDRINSGLVEIYQQISDSHLWEWEYHRFMSPDNVTSLIDGLRKSLLNRDKAFGKGRLESEVIGELKWLNLRGVIDLIGREIESLVMDEIVAEVIS